MFICACAVIMPKYRKGAYFGIIVVMAKTLYGYWSDYPCLLGVAGPNVVGVSTIKTEKCILNDVICGVMIYDDLCTMP